MAFANNAVERGVGDGDVALHAVLGAKIELDARLQFLDVPVLERGRAEAFVRFGISGVADAQMGGVEQPHDGGEHGLALQLAAPQMALDLFADFRERLAEGDDGIELGDLGEVAIIVVVAILLAPALVDARCLNMPACVLAEPDVFIGGRNGERIEPLNDVVIVELVALLVMITPASAAAHPGVTGFLVTGMPQVTHGSAPFRIAKRPGALAVPSMD